MTEKAPHPIPSERPRRVLQIAVSEGSGYVHLFALCHDGTLWRHHPATHNAAERWSQLPPVPGTEP